MLTCLANAGIENSYVQLSICLQMGLKHLLLLLLTCHITAYGLSLSTCPPHLINLGNATA